MKFYYSFFIYAYLALISISDMRTFSLNAGLLTHILISMLSLHQGPCGTMAGLERRNNHSTKLHIVVHPTEHHLSKRIWEFA